MRRAAACSLAAAALVAVAGCGGGNDKPKVLPRAELIAKADARCRADRIAIAKIPTPSFDPTKVTAAQLPEAGDYIGKVVAVDEKTLDHLRGLGHPANHEGQYDQVLDAMDELIVTLKAAKQAADKGDIALFRASVQTLPDNKADELAKQFGFKECGQG